MVTKTSSAIFMVKIMDEGVVKIGVGDAAQGVASEYAGELQYRLGRIGSVR
jgi:hypothetical protein